MADEIVFPGRQGPLSPDMPVSVNASVLESNQHRSHVEKLEGFEGRWRSSLETHLKTDAPGTRVAEFWIVQDQSGIKIIWDKKPEEFPSTSYYEGRIRSYGMNSDGDCTSQQGSGLLANLSIIGKPFLPSPDTTAPIKEMRVDFRHGTYFVRTTENRGMPVGGNIVTISEESDAKSDVVYFSTGTELKIHSIYGREHELMPSSHGENLVHLLDSLLISKS